MEQGGYTPKELHFAQEGQQKLISGITKMSNAVKSTLGPMGNTVIIETPEHTHGITVTKDGVTDANSILLSDPGASPVPIGMVCVILAFACF